MAVTLIAPGRVFAWGNDGHRVAALIASALLNDNARDRLRLLIGTDDLSTIATRMDEERDAFEARHPGSARWHYENRAVCGNDVQCPQGQCVTRQVERHLNVLRDPKASAAQQAEAVTVVVHLLADLHQPLHLADNRDRGGNDYWVLLPKENGPRTLHEVWDSRLVRLNLQRRAPGDYAQRLLKSYGSMQASFQQGDVESWAAETHLLARNRAYRALPNFACTTGRSRNDERKPMVLPAAYMDVSRPIVSEQLAKAGVRIAFVLNSALAGSR